MKASNQSARLLKEKATFLKRIRTFFDSKDFTEIQTSCLTKAPGCEEHLSYFETKYRDCKSNYKTLYLRSSPELAIKHLLSSELCKVYELGPCFRNFAESAQLHRPEFQMLEYYMPLESMYEFIDFGRDFFAEILDLNSEEFKRMSVYEAFEEFAGITLLDLDTDLAAKAVEKKIPSVKLTDDFETSYFKILLDKIEPALVQFDLASLYDYPPSQCALAK